MENTTKVELNEVVGVYERGEAVGTSRGLQAGMVIGMLVTLTGVSLVIAAFCAAGLLQFTPRPNGDATRVATGPIGDPWKTPAGVVPPLTQTGPVGLPPGGPAAPLTPGLPPAPSPSDGLPGLPPGADKK